MISMPDPQDKDARLDYEIDWSDFIPEGDTIAASEWESNDVDFVVENGSFTNTTTTIWARGGVAGTAYQITNHITTAQGREEDRTLKIKVKEL